MTAPLRERAAVVALLRVGRRPPQEYAEALEAGGSALRLLDTAVSEAGAQTTLLPVDPGPMVERAEQDIGRWEAEGFRLLTLLDDGYPANLREVHDRPVLVFIAGAVAADDTRAVAVVGARRASEAGIARAEACARSLAASDYAVVSGLAAGIDTAAHRAALSAGGRTLAVIGTGLGRAYPPENAGLQRQIAHAGAVISQFWPEDGPTSGSFRMRNAVMSGISRGTVLVEASIRSGARLQARLALGHGRPVFLMRSLVEQRWARDLSARPGVHVVDDAEQVLTVIERLDELDAPVW